MLPDKFSTTSTFVLERPFPAAPDPAHAAMKVHEDLSLAASDLRALHEGISSFSVPWFEVLDQQNYDFRHNYRWTYGYVLQTDGPFIANFTFTRDRAGFAVALDDNLRTTTRWAAFATTSAALVAVRRHVEEKLTAWRSGFY